MGNAGPILAQTASLSVKYPEMLLEGVSQQNYASFARPGGEVVRSNHPAFILGHLSLYPEKAFELLGRDGGSVAPPKHYVDLFAAGASCDDDPAGTKYPPLAELKQRYFDGYNAVLAIMPELSDDDLQRENPNEGRSREIFPTVGAALGFYMSGHVMMHMGQWSAWRRAMGLPPVS